MGKPAGAIFDVVNHGTGSSTLKDSGGEIVVPTASIEILPDEPEAPAREQEPPVEREDYGKETELLARFAYDSYNEKVGGVAWNGDPLPDADEFFEDPLKQKQANAWRHSIREAFQHAAELGLIASPEKDGDDELVEAQSTDENSSTGDDDRFAEESLPESGVIAEEEAKAADEADAARTEEQAAGNDEAGEGNSSDPAEDSQLDEKPEKE